MLKYVLWQDRFGLIKGTRGQGDTVTRGDVRTKALLPWSGSIEAGPGVSKVASERVRSTRGDTVTRGHGDKGRGRGDRVRRTDLNPD